MVDLPDALEEIRSPDERSVAEFHELLGGDDALESGSDPCVLRAKWIDVVVERKPPEIDGPGTE